MNTIWACVFAVALAVAPAFPWATYDDVSPPPTQLGSVCDDAMIYRINDEWRVASNPSRDIFMHSTDGAIDFVYFTAGTKENKRIVVKKVLSIGDAQKSDPCDWFRGIDA